MKEFRWFINPKTEFLLLVVVLATVVAFSAFPFAALYYPLLGSMVFPLLLLLLASKGGWLSSLAALALMVIGFYRFHPQHFSLAILYLLPTLLAFLLSLEYRLSFPTIALLVMSCFIVSTLLVYLILVYLCNGQPYIAFTEAMLKGLDRYPDRDPLLYVLWTQGFLSHGQASGASVIVKNASGWSFSTEVLQEFYNQIRLRLDAVSRSFIPGILSVYSIFLSSLGLCWALKRSTLSSEALSAIDMPEFQFWHIPQTYRLYYYGLGLGFLGQQITSPQFQLAGSLMVNVFTSISTVQGLSVFDYFLHRKNLKSFLRHFILLLVFMVFQPVLSIIGFADQFIDFRKLRTLDI